jgi:hypothetical protein
MPPVWRNLIVGTIEDYEKVARAVIHNTLILPALAVKFKRHDAPCHAHRVITQGDYRVYLVELMRTSEMNNP